MIWRTAGHGSIGWMATANQLERLSMTETDVVIIGAGHNGLTCAAYLAMAGLRVRVVERRKVVGGAAVTEEFHPGFRNSVAAYTVSLLNPQVIRVTSSSPSTGLRIVERRAQNFLPAPDGSYLLTGEGRTHSVSRAAQRRVMPMRSTCSRASCEGIADVLRHFVLRAPPNLRQWHSARPRSARRQRAAERQHPARAVAGAQPQPARPLHPLGRRDARRAFPSTISSRRCSASTPSSATTPAPTRPGSAYVMLHHAFGEVNAQEGRLGPRHRRHGRDHAGDGSAARDRGAAIETGCRRARGDRRARPRRRRGAGERRHASARRHVAANVNLKLLYTRLIAAGRAARRFPRPHPPLEERLGTFRMNVALDRLLPPSRRCRATAITSPPVSSWRRAPRLHGSRLSRCARAGLEPRTCRRDADPLDARRHARAGGQRTSRACSTSTSRLSCPAASPGTTIATRSPIS